MLNSVSDIFFCRVTGKLIELILIIFVQNTSYLMEQSEVIFFSIFYSFDTY